MTINLTKDEKAQIINNHIKSLSYTKYNLEIDILQENAKSSPVPSSISTLEDQIEDVEGQISALNAELTAVNALPE
jgi:predicted  nucleic acid-binding Zn-ribbon protein